MPSAVDWLESLSPWPEEFGLGRMRALLAELGEPQRVYPAIHVVGTNGKSTATRRAAAFLGREGALVGAYTSPHVAGWSERVQVDGEDADLEHALERVRPAAVRLGATQFEVLTAAALAEFAAAEVEVAVVEAGLGGRLDATNVLAAPVVALTNVALEHTDVLGSTREAIAAEKLAVVAPGATAVLGEPEWKSLARARGAAAVVHADDVGRAAAEAFLGRPLEGDVEISLPGRYEQVGEDVFAGAHNPAGVAWLVERLPRRDYVVVASILADKDAEAMLAALASAGRALVATSSRNARALPAEELARRAAPFFDPAEAVGEAGEALARGRELAGDDGAVLVTGSLYLLADLTVRLQRVPWVSSASG
ncbi:MAG: Mur ligase family protein [Actinomycetota bacterium]|nr:Mur ligase family protein [Actinomycetota bacterium]